MEKAKPQTNPILRAIINPSRTKAIHAMCCQCMGCTGDHLEPGFRTDIKECSSMSCPLWQYRPFQSKDKDNTQ